MLVLDFLTDSVARYPEKEFLAWRGRHITYGFMMQNIDALVAGLVGEGLAAGDRVGLCMWNSPEYVLVYFAVLKAGAVVVPVSDQTNGRGIANILNDCQASLLFIEEPLLPHVLEVVLEIPSLQRVIVVNKRIFTEEEEEAVERIDKYPAEHLGFLELRQVLQESKGKVVHHTTRGHDLAMILYTSGTTGSPKGVMLTNRNLVANADSIVQSLRLTANDKTIAVLPFCYSYGNSLLTTHAKVGGCILIERNFVYPNAVLERMVREGATGFAGVPSTFAILLNRSGIRKYAFPKLRYVTQAGGAMPPKHAQELSQILPNAEIFLMYGQTEASPRLTCLDSTDFLRKPGSIGKPVPGVKITIRGEDSTPCAPKVVGEIVAEGDNIMKGYWGDPEGSARVLRDDGLHTGDMAWMDEEGYIYITGRKSQMIKSGGHRISPQEIEETILELPTVHEVAVVGLEDEILGESITAFIVPKNMCVIDSQDVKRHCMERLSAYQVPRKVLFLDELPKTATGKIKKHELL